MKQLLKKVSAILLTAFVFFTLCPADFASAESDPALKTPTLTRGSAVTNIIKVAQSQVGYHESDDGETVYSDWLGMYGRAWCSEFVAWSAYKAGIPSDVIPKATSVRKYRDFYSDRNSFFLVKGGACRDCECSGFASETIELSDIMPGDIAFIETNGDPNTGDDHTALVISVGEGFINTVEGNLSDTVKLKTRTADKIHGICRPDYSQVSYTHINVKKPVLKASMTKDKDILKWTAIPGVKGYQIYRSTTRSGTYKLIRTVKGEDAVKTSFTNTYHKKYYYKISSYNTYRSVKYRSSYSNIVNR